MMLVVVDLTVVEVVGAVISKVLPAVVGAKVPSDKMVVPVAPPATTVILLPPALRVTFPKPCVTVAVSRPVTLSVPPANVGANAPTMFPVWLPAAE